MLVNIDVCEENDIIPPSNDTSLILSLFPRTLSTLRKQKINRIASYVWTTLPKRWDDQEVRCKGNYCGVGKHDNFLIIPY